ncbi:sulfate/molybdate ABC transporter ATP-binding protein [Arcticibacterium luteifluviistationis]|uniref:Molybdenum ABC transporter ATP-binding protein n=1 Tax=Arcticibacterium luteifluviistationis TaxID=1784714 RepID=A0A2Z4G831_9BACT|nr:ATP-binding cassette domain-containing protein [Arcticibacterium luteifluviistationis]AWV97213.1 molybdenum ABC transporter ATP-binding protein [Arcticibacterium luteifluviistationis]
MVEINIKKSFPSDLKLDIALRINKGDFVTLFGTSGAGKTTTLKIISGLLKPDAGYISVNDNTWFDSEKKVNLSTQKRSIGYVFQDFALFPNMTVRQNLEFALSKKQDNCLIDELIALTELESLEHRKPETLSGGQKQRVALARALVQQPEILLLDEPLSALDNQMRQKLQAYILKLHKKYKLTTILVSHDIGEIVKLSDQIFEIEDGKISKKGNVKEFFGLNKTSAKFRFSGEVIDIIKEDVIYIVSILIGNDIVKIVADQNEVENLEKGDKVFVASKAFNPIIQKVAH